MNKPQLTIIIPCYNEVDSIEICLESVLAQSHINWECIVVDDGSTDKTIAIIEIYCKKDSRFQLFKQAHQGPAKARNLAAAKAQGDILVFVDADMVLDEKYLTALIKPIVAKKTIGSFTLDERVSNWSNPWARCWNYEYTGAKTNRRLPSNHPTTSRVFRAITKVAFESVGGYDDIGYNDDWTLSKKLGIEAMAADDAIVYHKNPASATKVALQASWVGKRDYKFGVVGSLWALCRANPFFSLVMGIMKALYFAEPHYIVFKYVYNAGLTVGILMSMKQLPRSR